MSKKPLTKEEEGWLKFLQEKKSKKESLTNKEKRWLEELKKKKQDVEKSKKQDKLKFQPRQFFQQQNRLMAAIQQSAFQEKSFALERIVERQENKVFVSRQTHEETDEEKVFSYEQKEKRKSDYDSGMTNETSSRDYIPTRKITPERIDVNRARSRSHTGTQEIQYIQSQTEQAYDSGRPIIPKRFDSRERGEENKIRGTQIEYLEYKPSEN